MALTPSKMIPLGSTAPAFSLPDTVSGKTVSLADFKNAPALVVMFICNHCPYVKHIKKELAEFGRKAQEKGAAVVAISSNDAQAYPQDGPGPMKEDAKAFNYSFPYLFDESQNVARAYDAACTPDFYLFDREQKLVYRGQFDDSRPGNGKPVTGRDLEKALDLTLAGKPVPADEQKPSIGCNIKFR